MERINIIDGVPRILEEVPNLVPTLEKSNGWREEKKPSDVLKNWESETTGMKFYFLGWLRKSVANNGVFSLLRYFGLREKRAITTFLDNIIEEASIEELKQFERGEKETFRQRRFR